MKKMDMMNFGMFLTDIIVVTLFFTMVYLMVMYGVLAVKRKVASW
jgi:hypothetical protein